MPKRGRPDAPMQEAGAVTAPPTKVAADGAGEGAGGATPSPRRGTSVPSYRVPARPDPARSFDAVKARHERTAGVADVLVVSRARRGAGAQRPRTAELLVIVVHQVYELWFNQLLHEGAYLQRRLEVADMPHALATLRRMLTIVKTIVAQIDVLETMTPRQFLAFVTAWTPPAASSQRNSASLRRCSGAAS
jgi:hypothetical protein